MSVYVVRNCRGRSLPVIRTIFLQTMSLGALTIKHTIVEANLFTYNIKECYVTSYAILISNLDLNYRS